MKNAILLCSGGIDSVVTAHYVKKRLKYKNIIVLFFDYGQKTSVFEEKFSRNCAKELGARFMKINLKWLSEVSSSLINRPGKIKKLSKKDLRDTKKESEKFYVPCRNLIFLSYALSLADSLKIKEKKDYDIFVGFKCEGNESYPDTTPEFVNGINDLIKMMKMKKIRVIAPLIKKDKEDIILLGEKLNVNFEDTLSCYIDKNCGECLACKLRQQGFYWANVVDPTEYINKKK